MSRLLFPVVWMMICCVSIGAWAKSNDAQAKKFFVEGTTLYNDGKFHDAAEQFRRAYEMKPSWKLWFNIGQAEAAAKQYGLALEAFEKYLAQGGDEVSKERFDEVIDEMKRLRQLVGNLEIEGAPKGAVIRINDMERGVLPLATALRVSMGVQHRVEILFNNKIIHSQTLSVGSTATATIMVGNQALADRDEELSGFGTGEGSELTSSGERVLVVSDSNSQDSASQTSEPSDSSKSAAEKNRLRSLKIFFFSSLGLAVVSGGLAIGFWSAAGNKEEELTSMETQYREDQITFDDYTTRYNSTLNSMNRFDGLSTAMLITSGVCITTSTVALILLLKNKKQRSTAFLLSPTGIAFHF
ncbi:MAG: tetratricopeptide repeat protein [Deltaproteobacteria bacterium]|nr:tetratricopeptide repeat protein [Deltaproteobacteria bacterium]MBN2671751.1 tetratricopeptide repeat protein [Deltaproteobacteria bacterium]